MVESAQPPQAASRVEETPDADTMVVRRAGLSGYDTMWRAMMRFTHDRAAHTADEVWLLEHHPVYTVGLSCKDAGPFGPGGIPLVSSDRGGQITYHGPGQLVAYVMVDLRRRSLGVRALVDALEQAVIDVLAAGGVAGERRAGAPGVYVGGRKIAALGLRVRRGCTYHGLSLNVDMDLEPFGRIDPCGYRGLEVTQLAALGLDTDMRRVGNALVASLAEGLEYNRLVTGDW
jgi:lipoyl(octanoyl) transferase